ncbi:MAG TPA: hypothetical protein VGF40_16190 [Thermoanaerobaculia bacterium]
MRKITHLLAAAAFLALAACAPGGGGDPIAAEWRQVLAAKKEWQRATPRGRLAAHQAYVDALTAFVRRHPDHPRARAVYEETELEFARELARRGWYDQAAVYYRSVLRTSPDHADARSELREVERKRFVTPEALGGLRVGMSPEEVRGSLGQPLPGWSRSMRRGDSVIDSWYYRRRDGGAAGVYFRNGRLFAAECGGAVRLKS